MRHIKSTGNIGRAHKVTDELSDLCTMAMEYFKEKMEPTLPEITIFGMDFLDYATSCMGRHYTYLNVGEVI